MSEWWTYRLSDFLMFSPQAYWRLVARYNEAWWPLQLAGVAAAIVLPWVLWREGERARRGSLVVLALAWGWLGWAFEARQYAEIFLGATWLAAGCAVQAMLLVAACLVPGRGHRRPAWLLLCAAAASYPLLAPATGHPWVEAEVFGFMPDPTALATLGAVLAGLHAPWMRALLLAIPALTLLLGLATRSLLAS